jgi:hypothetical protein
MSTKPIEVIYSKEARKMINRFSEAELQRYSRNISLPEIGLAGQERMRSSSVLIVGAGGIGCPSALYLVASGIENCLLKTRDEANSHCCSMQFPGHFLNDQLFPGRKHNVRNL